ncbi:MAG TPA: alpha amylase C-terminal domain-containing protein, partial [Calditrichia bacterium]|nr:alpha amylase C-terminal domain-containing protein [Calditrichia bacterium]
LKQLPTDREKSVFAFVREKEGYAVLAVFNLGKTARDLKISGQIQPGTYRGLYQEEEIVVAPGSELAFNLPAWGYKVLVRHPQ